MLSLFKHLIKTIRRRTPLGWLQLKHDRMRLLTAISGIAFADILIFMQFGFMDALYKTNTQYPRYLRADLILTSTQATHFNKLSTFPRRRLYQAMDIPGVESADALYVGSLDWRNPQTRLKTSMMVLGQNPNRPTFNLPQINQQLNLIKLPNTVLFDQASRGDYQAVVAAVAQGSPMAAEIGRRTVQIRGLFTLGASFSDDGALITSHQNFLRLFPKREAGVINMGLINIKSDYLPEPVSAALNAYLPEDVTVRTYGEYLDFEMAYIQKRTPIGFVFTLGRSL